MDWNIIEAWTYVAGILLANLIPIFYLLIFEKDINPKRYLTNKKIKIYLNTYAKFRFDIDRLNVLEQEIDELNVEIDELKKASISARRRINARGSAAFVMPSNLSSGL